MLPVSGQLNVRRTAGLVAAGAAVTAWLYAAESTDVRVAAAPERRSPARTGQVQPAIQIPALHERVPPSAALRHSRRDVFAFNVARTTPTPETARPRPAEVPAPAPPLSLTLVGVAEEAAASGLMRTAIISAGGALVLAREGDLVSARYRVVHISTGAVDLVELSTSATLQLQMH